jgi:hypothetical protein
VVADSIVGNLEDSGCLACGAVELAVVADSYSLDDAFEMDVKIVDDDVRDVDASFSEIFSRFFIQKRLCGFLIVLFWSRF